MDMLSLQEAGASPLASPILGSDLPSSDLSLMSLTQSAALLREVWRGSLPLVKDGS